MSDEPVQKPTQKQLSIRYRPGESGNPAGYVTRRLKLERKIAELAVPYGALAPDETELIRQAALLTMRKVHDADQQVRVANALRSIFELLAERRSKPRPIPLADDIDDDDVVAAALRQLRQGSEDTGAK